MKRLAAILLGFLGAFAGAQTQAPTTITNLPAAAPLTGTEVMPCDQGGNGNTKKCSVSQVTAQTITQLAPSAIIDTTNASNITKGTLPCPVLPALTGALISSGCGTLLAPQGADTLLGNPTSTSASPVPVNIGTGLSFTGNTLNAAATSITLTSPDNSIVVGGSPGSNLTVQSNVSNVTNGVLPVGYGGTGVTTSTGTGSVVLGTAPAITLPNATGLPLSTGVTGTLPIANGGTGAATLAAANIPTIATSGAGNCVQWATATTLGNTGTPCGSGMGGGGTVTSIGVTVPSYLSVSPGTITTNGTFAITGASEPINEVLASPASGSAGALAPRSLVVNDIPTLPLASKVSGTLQAAQFPAISGDATVAAGTLTSSVGKVNGGSLPTNAAVLSTNGSAQITTAASTGSGSVVLATSPTLVTPALGTPSAINLANATFPTTISSNTTGNAATATSATRLNNGVIPTNAPGIATNGSGQLISFTPVTGSGTSGNCAQWTGTSTLTAASAPCGTGTSSISLTSPDGSITIGGTSPGNSFTTVVNPSNINFGSGALPVTAIPGSPCDSAFVVDTTPLEHSGVVATNPATVNYQPYVDGENVPVNTIFLLQDQGVASQNGFWETPSSFGGSGTLYRPACFQTGSSTQAVAGQAVTISLGSVNAGSTWALNIYTPGTITIDSTLQEWEKIAGSGGGSTGADVCSFAATGTPCGDGVHATAAITATAGQTTFSVAGEIASSYVGANITVGGAGYTGCAGEFFTGIFDTTNALATAGSGILPGDTFTLAGGTYVSTYACQWRAFSTTVQAATIASTGTCTGTGTATITGTTGQTAAGVGFIGTVAMSSGTISGAITLTNGQSYVQPPTTYDAQTDSAAEPVTVTGTGLSCTVNPTISVSMGAKSAALTPIVAGEYTAVPSDPVSMASHATHITFIDNDFTTSTGSTHDDMSTPWVHASGTYPLTFYGTMLSYPEVITGIAITGTAGQFSCTCALGIGLQVKISGTFGGTGSIAGYVNPTTYQVTATGTNTFTLGTLGGSALVTMIGTPTGLTYTVEYGQTSTQTVTGTFTKGSTAVTWTPALNFGTSYGTNGNANNVASVPGFCTASGNSCPTLTLSTGSGLPGNTSWQGEVLNTTISALSYNSGTNTTTVTIPTPILSSVSLLVSNVAITGGAGQFSCACSLSVGTNVTISGTFGGTGSISGYVNPTTYLVTASGTNTFTLSTLGSSALVTMTGTPKGLTYTTNAARTEWLMYGHDDGATIQAAADAAALNAGGYIYFNPTKNYSLYETVTLPGGFFDMDCRSATIQALAPMATMLFHAGNYWTAWGSGVQNCTLEGGGVATQIVSEFSPMQWTHNYFKNPAGDSTIPYGGGWSFEMAALGDRIADSNFFNDCPPTGADGEIIMMPVCPNGFVYIPAFNDTDNQMDNTFGGGATYAGFQDDGFGTIYVNNHPYEIAAGPNWDLGYSQNGGSWFITQAYSDAAQPGIGGWRVGGFGGLNLTAWEVEGGGYGRYGVQIAGPGTVRTQNIQGGICEVGPNKNLCFQTVITDQSTMMFGNNTNGNEGTLYVNLPQTTIPASALGAINLAAGNVNGGVTGITPVANGGTNQSSVSCTAQGGANMTVTGTWPNCTYNSAVTGGGYTTINGSLPFISPPTGYMDANGNIVLGANPPTGATMYLSSNTAGTGITITFNAAALAGTTAGDTGRVITIYDTGSSSYKTAIITTYTDTQHATVTLNNTLTTACTSGSPCAITNLWLSGPVYTAPNAAAAGVTYSAPLNTTYANAYVYFLTGAPTPAAGWYFCKFTYLTTGTCYNYVYTTGQPEIPASPPAFTGLPAGTFVNSSATVLGPNYSVPANALGITGLLDFTYSTLNDNSTGTKNSNAQFGGIAVATAISNTTGLYGGVTARTSNNGVATTQTTIYSVVGSAGGTAPSYTSVNTGGTNVISGAAFNIFGNTDWVVFTQYTEKLYQSN